MKNYFVVGKIISTHALKGEVKIFSTTDFAHERYKKGNLLFIEKDNEFIEVKVKSHRVHKEFNLVSFENYNDIDQVMNFVKCKVYVHESQLQELEKNEFYYHELIECEVYHNDKRIGKVENVVNYGASDILIVIDENNKELMIPFVDDFICEVDCENKKILINVIEGLLGEN